MRDFLGELMLNLDALYKRLMQDEKLVRTVLQAFFKDLPLQISQLNSAAETQDYKALAKAAHKLRGAAGNIGAEKLHELLGELEDASKKEDSKTVAQFMEHLDKLNDEMKKTAKKLLQ